MNLQVLDVKDSGPTRGALRAVEIWAQGLGG